MSCFRLSVARLGVILFALSLSGCGGTTDPPAEPPTIVSAGGSGQVGSVGLPLTAPLAVQVRTASGDPIPGTAVSWATSTGSLSASTTATDADGVALVTWTLGGVPGPQTATGSLDGATGSPVTFTATANAVVPPSPMIAGIAPNPVIEGQAATITGTGFGSSAAGLTVTIDGAAASILQVTPTAIDILVPTADCKPARTGDIRVLHEAAESNTLTVPLEPANFVTVAAGQQVVLRGLPGSCLQFDASPGTSDYLIGVQSTSEVVSNLTPVTLTGTVTGAAVAPLPSLSVAAVRTANRSEPVLAPARPDRARRWERHRAAESRLWSVERALAGRSELIRAGRVSRFSTAAAATFQVGDTIVGSVPDVPNDDLCNPIPVTSVVRNVGTHGIWLEDVDNPAGGYSQADFDDLSAQLDDLIYTTDVSYFGEPTDLDETGHIFVLITKEVNRNPGALGFVSPSDLFSQASCASSNQGEIFYGAAPDPTGIFALGEYPADEAKADAPFLIAHELTHIIQQSRRLYVAQGPFMAQWTAEGQATLAEEVVGFAAEGHAPGQNLGFDVALNLDDPASTDWYSNKIFDLAVYYGFQGTQDKIAGAPNECSWLDRAPANNGPCLPGREVYGVPWSLLRWLSDQYGPGFADGEQGLQQALINSTAVGYANIAEVVGVPIETLLARWAAALYVDDRVPGANEVLSIPTWNLFNIFEMNGGPAVRLTPVSRGFGAFTETADVRAGSAAYYRISGANAPATAVRISGPGGAALPSSMQVFVVRLR